MHEERPPIMPKIVETIVTTSDGDGNVHIAPLGLIADGDHWLIGPFKPSRTLDNLRAVPFAVASHTQDVRVFAGCLTGRKDWPLKRAGKVPGSYLAVSQSHWELKVVDIEEDDVRPKFRCKLVHQEAHAPFAGLNRAQAAVIECAVLVSRLKMLEADKIEAELKYLEIAISKTAGPEELEAWSWLMERVDAWRVDQKNK